MACLLTCGFLNAASPGEWRSYGNDPGGARFSELDQINRKNVGRLKKAWEYHTGEIAPGTVSTLTRRVKAFETTPLVIGGVMYLSTPSSRVIALDAATGSELWKFDPQQGRKKRLVGPHRGVAYWEGVGAKGGRDRRILFGTVDGQLIALDAATGHPCPDFGNDGSVNLRVGVADRFPESDYSVTSPPAIFEDLVITGAQVPEGPSNGPSGAVRAFHVRTGKLVWTFHTVPLPRQPGHDTWEGDSWKDRTGVNVWSIISVDPARGMIFLPVGSPAYDFYGGDRVGKNLYGNSVLALNARTGKLIWYYQLVHHDVWDYDLPAQPVLMSVRRDGREIPAVAQVTKMGFVFILDRLTGKPLFPVEERPVPHSDVPGEAAWPTQPFPLKPPPLVRQTISVDDITNITPETNSFCAALYASSVNRGMYTPYGKKLTLVLPGTLGGATWSGGSFDPTSGLLYVNVNELGSVGMMKEQPPESPIRFRRASEWGEYARFWDEKGYSCIKPPWGTLNAVDVSKGEIAWKVPLGVMAELEAKGVPQTGTPNLGGAIATAGGVVFIAGTIDSRFRAFDSQTGRELWVGRLDASGHATPSTYLGKNGKQYVVIAAGGGGYFSQAASDTLVAFALP